MLDLNTLALASGVDLIRINPYASDFDQRVEMSNQLVRKWMKDPVNKSYLNEKKAEYIHSRGLSVGHNMKHELDIPQEAFVMLPVEIRNDRKELMKWVEKFHPYLMHKRMM